MSAFGIIPWRRALPPREPEPVAMVTAYGGVPLEPARGADAWPDPYGPDPVVFGPPRTGLFSD